jgi:hypothetical protein
MSKEEVKKDEEENFDPKRSMETSHRSVVCLYFLSRSLVLSDSNTHTYIYIDRTSM